jgi:hypothetical protein
LELPHPQKELLKSVGKFKNVLAFAEEEVKQVLTSVKDVCIR